MKITMTRTLFERLSEDLEVKDNYSGRFMYGRSCFGFIGSTTDVSKFYSIIHYIAANKNDSDYECADSIFEANPEMLTDSMALEYIFYFPDIEVEETDN